MGILKSILRIVVALVFIASGFVKAVDPVGFSFKLEEYFSPTVFNMPFLEKYALAMAVFVVILEVALGLLLLFKMKLKFTLAALITLCVFFGFLTFYSAYFNVVTDCGCFGDAMKMTPWQSFWKDIALLGGLIALWFLYNNEFAESRKKVIWKNMLLGVLGVAVGWFIGKGIYQEPLIDFRDYKVGTNLKLEKQKLVADPSEYKTFYVLKNNKTGEEKKVNQDDYVLDKTLWEKGTPWEIQKDKTSSEIVKQGYESEIAKFRIEKDGNDITDQILDAEHVVLLFSYKPSDLTVEKRKAAESAVTGNPLVYGVSTNPATFSKLTNTTMDGTAIKTIARSNPFVLVLHKGKIVEKVPAKNFR